MSLVFSRARLSSKSVMAAGTGVRKGHGRILRVYYGIPLHWTYVAGRGMHIPYLGMVPGILIQAGMRPPSVSSRISNYVTYVYVAPKVFRGYDSSGVYPAYGVYIPALENIPGVWV